MTDSNQDFTLDSYPDWRELGTTHAWRVTRQIGLSLCALMLVLITLEFLTERPKGRVYVVASGDTGSEIAQRLGISFEELANLNQGIEWKRLQPGHKLKIPKPRRKESNVGTQFSTYVVKRGDMGSAIAVDLGITFADLDRLNPGTAWDRIQPGQRLRYPGRNPRAGAASAALVAGTRTGRTKNAKSHLASRTLRTTSSAGANVEPLNLDLPVLPLVSENDGNGGPDGLLLDKARRLIELGQLTRAHQLLHRATSESAEIEHLRREVEQRLQELG